MHGGNVFSTTVEKSAIARDGRLSPVQGRISYLAILGRLKSQQPTENAGIKLVFSIFWGLKATIDYASISPPKHWNGFLPFIWIPHNSQEVVPQFCSQTYTSGTCMHENMLVETALLSSLLAIFTPSCCLWVVDNLVSIMQGIIWGAGPLARAIPRWPHPPTIWKKKTGPLTTAVGNSVISIVQMKKAHRGKGLDLTRRKKWEVCI